MLEIQEEIEDIRDELHEVKNNFDNFDTRLRALKLEQDELAKKVSLAPSNLGIALFPMIDQDTSATGH